VACRLWLKEIALFASAFATVNLCALSESIVEVHDIAALSAEIDCAPTKSSAQ
jgi:hypothetical protein